MGLDVAEIGMGADLSLDLRHFASKAVRQEARDAPASELDAFIRQLEEEQSKIVAFRSELPVCVRIVAYAIGAMKEEKRKNEGEEEDRAAGDKSSWMKTAQLWTGGSDGDAAELEEQDNNKQEKNTLQGKDCGGRAFVPVKAVGSGAPAFSPPPYVTKDGKQPARADVGVPDLSLLTPPAIQSAPAVAAGGSVADECRHRVVGFAQAAARAAAAVAPAAAPALSLQPQPLPQATQQQQQARKSRRCWSAELHRQFVAALNQLGGPHAATPKQIRELMKVDGLTNDEVKSHLQKYRLHNRRTDRPAVVNQPFLMVGTGLWIAHQQEPSSSHQSGGSPHGPLHYSATASGIIAGSSTATASGEEEDGSVSESYGWI